MLKQVIKLSRVSKRHYKELNELVDIAEKADGFKTKLYGYVLEARATDNFDDFFYYIDNKLVAYLGLFIFKDKEVEFSGLVHPKYRRQGLFNELFRLALDEVKRRKMIRAIFICHQSDNPGMQFAKSLGAEHKHSVAHMRYVHEPTVTDLPDVSFRVATEDDIKTMALMAVRCFNNEYDYARMQFTENMKEKNRVAWIAEVDGKPIGKTHIRFDTPIEAFIHDLCVIPEFQRKGYASAIVLKQRDYVFSHGAKILSLDILSEQTHLIEFYKKCGFDIIFEYSFMTTLVNDIPR